MNIQDISPLVLVVDDTADIRTTCEVQLGMFGYTVACAEDGVQMMDMLKREIVSPDVILLDQMMPRHEGLSLLPELRALKPETPVIMLTAHGSVRLATEFMRNGGADFIEKPFDPDVLNLKIHRALQTASLRRERDEAVRERNRQSAQLALHAAQLMAVFQTVGSGIVVSDEQGTIVSTNPAVNKMFGFDEDELTGKPLTILMPEPDRSRHDKYISDYLCSGNRRMIGIVREVHAIRKSGDVFPIELRVTEMFSESSRYFVGSLIDLSDRRAAEIRARQAEVEKRAAEEASRAKSGFLSTVSHEIRTPLTAILGFAEEAMDWLREEENIEMALHLLKRIIGNAERQRELINDILDLSRIETGRMEYHWKECSLADVVYGVAEELRPVANGRNLTVGIYDDTGIVAIWGDALKLSRVIENLIGNALKFARNGTEVSIRLSIEDNVFRFSIVDQGVAIPEDELEAIFDPFTQSSATDSGAGGSGLGLTLARKIITDHGGHIWAKNLPESRVGFYFTVPLERRSS